MVYSAILRPDTTGLIMIHKSCFTLIILAIIAANAGSCWDEPNHEYDTGDNSNSDTGSSDTDSDADTDTETDTGTGTDSDTGSDADTDTDTDTDSDTDSETESDTESDTDSETDSDTDTDTSTGPGQGNLPEGWENFGGPCIAHEDCTGYPRARCVDSSILGLINVPGGYCTACCDSAASWCAEGIQCIGADDVYLICAATCDSSDQCRQDEGYECRQVPYLEDPGVTADFCLPDNEHIEPDTDITPLDLECDWPWVN